MISKLAIGSVYALLYYLASAPHAQQNFHEQISPKQLFYNVATQYSVHFFATMCHELGHAIAAKATNGDPIKIHLGANTTKITPKKNPWPITIAGLNPLAGYTQYTTPKKIINNAWVTDNAKLAAILLSGCLGGIIGNSLRKAVLGKPAFEFDEIILRELINALVPCSKAGNKSDATHLYERCFQIHPSIIKTVGLLRNSLDIAGEYYLTKPRDQQTLGTTRQCVTRLLLALLNRELRGYLRFT